MKRILPIIIVLFVIACNNTKYQSAETQWEKLKADSTRIADSLTMIMAESEKMADHFSKESFLDTVGDHLAPVRVTKAYLFKEEYSSYKSIRLTFKNVSGKRIQAIRFEWYGENSFNEPADMGSYSYEGYGTGFDDDALGIGSSRSSTWSILSNDGKKVIGARAYEVAFIDGTKWERE